MTTQPAPCPVCGAPGGFHDDAPHVEARERIPAHLRGPSHTAERRATRGGGQ